MAKGFFSLVTPQGLLRDPSRIKIPRENLQIRDLGFCAQATMIEPGGSHSSLNPKNLWLSPKVFSLVTPQGFEPRTSASVVRCSIQLSYGAINGVQIYKITYYYHIDLCFFSFFINSLEIELLEKEVRVGTFHREPFDIAIFIEFELNRP